MKITDLKSNPLNPRKISDKKLSMLKKSLAKFGDLSGFVYNRRSKTLVGGHQRTKTIPDDAEIKIEVRHKTPTKAMTVAEGYIMIDGERFKYREVDADKTWETEALLAANKHSGEWDNELLRLAIEDTPGLDIDAAGFEIPELEELNIRLPSLESSLPEIGEESFSNAPTEEPDQADDETDEQYVQNTEQSHEQIPTENTNENTVSAFDEAEEKMNVVDKRFVIIIDCQNDEHKKSLKEMIKEQVVKAGGKFF